MKITYLNQSLLAIALLCFPIFSSSQVAPCYSARTDYNIGLEQNFMTQNDFDNDGKLDIVTSNQTWPNSGISFLKGNANGIFSLPVNTSFSLTTGGITSGDFNNDGSKDLLLVYTSNNSLGFISGNGNGSFNTPVYFSAGIGVENISSADFNSDGNLDFVTTNPTNFTVKVFLGNGNGTFQSGILYNVGNTPKSIAVEDLNGDNIKDLVVVNSSSPYSISVLLGSVSGAFSSQTTYSVGTDPRYAAITDFNNDGSKDIAVCNSGSSSFCILTGNGTGLFSSAISYTLPTVSPTCLVAADFNLDGIMDLAFSHANLSLNMNVTIMQGVGNATFILKDQLFTAANHKGSFILSGDYNSDGKSDISLSNYLGYNMSVFLNDNPLISVNTPTICSGQTTVIIPTGASSYSITGGTFSVSPISTTNYTVSGTSNGCSNSVAVSVVVNTLPSLSVSATSTTICSGQTATLTASGANSYSWTAGPSNPSYIVNASGIYTVTGMNFNNCVNSQTFELTVNPLPILTINSTSSLLCVGSSATVSVSGADSYTWNTGDNMNYIVASPSVTTVYSVIGTDVNNCSAIQMYTLQVSPCTTINEIYDLSIISIYPNPAFSYLFIKGVDEANTIEIVDVLGKNHEIALIKIDDNCRILDVSYIRKGLYYIMIYNRNHDVIKSEKVVIQ